jgi:hypothetical protein
MDESTIYQDFNYVHMGKVNSPFGDLDRLCMFQKVEAAIFSIGM